MPRTPDGTDLQPRTDAALFAHLAYKLEGVATGKLNDWAEHLGVALGADALRNAPHHAARLESLPVPRRVARRWILPDWRALDFFLALVELRLPSDGSGLLDSLEAIKGVVDLYVFQGGEAMALVAYERRSDRDDLRAQLSDLIEISSWRQVEDHRPDAIISTFRKLAGEAAAREGLATSPVPR
jgi:hypothetical protein